jgi:large subunit ribosomal protein L28
MKAYRCILKMGSVDNYILCTKPKDLDSKYGEYLRTIMLRKINDSSYKIPYILRSGRKERIKKYYRYLSDRYS